VNLCVNGMACLGSFGHGAEALLAGVPLAGVDGRANSADTSALKKKVSPRAIRQMDHFTRMALLCAVDALDAAGLSPEKVPASDVGIVLGTGFGPASPTFAFLDSILEYGEAMASPLAFSHSVHNIPAASMAIALGLAGPCSTVCQPDAPVTAAVLTAKLWLAEGRVRHVLAGAADEATGLLARNTRRIACENAALPREENEKRPPVSDGAVFFCLSAAPGPNVSGTISAVGFSSERDLPERLADGSDARLFFSGTKRTGRYGIRRSRRLEAVYGRIPIAQGFDMIFSLLEKDAEKNTAYCCAHTRAHTVGFVKMQKPPTSALRQGGRLGYCGMRK
jgi:3-oxoacyl-[acyl-carrier-protein] synthase II